eukprot:s2029_g2.t2
MSTMDAKTRTRTTHGQLQDLQQEQQTFDLTCFASNLGYPVENFNADTQTYRLDVQPYAPADRVRARRRGLPKRPEVANGHESVADAGPEPSNDRDTTPHRAVERRAQEASRETPSALPCEPGILELSLQDEVEMLRRRVAELEEQNRTLHSQVAHETELKERYRQELAELRNLT